MHLTASFLNMGLINQHIKSIFSFSLYFFWQLYMYVCIYCDNDILYKYIKGLAVREYLWIYHVYFYSVKSK